MSWEGFAFSLVGILAGWLLNEMSKRFQLSRERRAIIGRALSNLLALHHRVRVIEGCTDHLVKQLSLPESGRRAYKSSFEYVLPQGDEFVTRYGEAIDQLSETDPVTAFELRERAKISRLLSAIPAMATLQGASAEEILLVERQLKGMLIPALEKAIKELARLHDGATKRRVNDILKSPLTIPSGMEDLLQNAQAEHQKHLAGQDSENLN
ncbi:MAG: hypothetical protein HY937_05370 [Nitrosomonadales bacterium]|nr:hypothetical protein [Nitrosomonadales bacterium]